MLLKKHWRRLSDDAGKGVLTIPAEVTEEATRELFSNLEKGGMATFVVSKKISWNPRDDYFEEIREAARRGLAIQRVFLLPLKIYLRDKTLSEQIELDSQAGIKNTLLYVGPNSSPDLEAIREVGLDFGIWDNKVLCTISSAGTADGEANHEWRVSRRQEDLQSARLLWQELLAKGEELTYPPQPAASYELEEPMVESAPLMRELSLAVCKGSYLGKRTSSCSWYHGVWQYLRLFDMVSTPAWKARFYISTFKKAAREFDRARVLISGTADYSMLAHVLWAFDAETRPLTATVLDLCETPLIMNRWYCKRFQTHTETETVQSDVMQYDSQPYDMITTDAFLTRFEKQDRLKVIKSWSSLLRKGGMAITTVRLKNEYAQFDRFVPRREYIESFKAKAFEQAIRWRDFVDITPELIAGMAEFYAEEMDSYPVSSVADLNTEFEDSGFDIESHVTSVKGELVPTSYAEVVARRRG